MQPHELDETALALLERHGFGQGAVADMVGILRQAFRQHLQPGEYLCHEGDEGDAMWVLLRGRIQVSKRNFQGEEQDLAEISAPALLGHMALVDNVRRSASCTAMEPVDVATISLQEFRALMRSTSPRGDLFRGMILASLWRQLTRGNSVLADLLSPAKADAFTEEETSKLLTDASATFGGWG